MGKKTAHFVAAVSLPGFRSHAIVSMTPARTAGNKRQESSPAIVRLEFVKKPTTLGISRSGGTRNPHVFQYTLRLLVPSVGLAPAGLALRFAPGKTVLRSGGTRPPFARDGFFTNS